MKPRFFNVNVDGLAPENSSPFFLESADRGPIPLVLLADDDAGGSIGSTPLGIFCAGEIKLSRIKHNSTG